MSDYVTPECPSVDECRDYPCPNPDLCFPPPSDPDVAACRDLPGCDGDEPLCGSCTPKVPMSVDDAARLYLRQLRASGPSAAVLMIIEQIEDEMRDRQRTS